MNLPLKSISKVLFVCLLFVIVSGQAVASVPKININTADVQQLSQLKRIGSGYASRIIEYREKNGAFKTPEEIMKVKGIGKKAYEVNKDIIIVKEEEGLN